MAKQATEPDRIHFRIIDVMKRFPEGISATKIRDELEIEGVCYGGLGDLVQRIWELDKWFIIETTNIVLPCNHGKLVGDEVAMTAALRAQVLYAAKGRCSKCAKRIKTDNIRLVVRLKGHRRCREAIDRDDLWAICENCDTATSEIPFRRLKAGPRPGSKFCRTSRGR